VIATQARVDEQAVVPPELWERVAGLPAAWLAARPVVAARWARVRAVGLWVALVWVVVLLVVVPDVRGSVRAYAGSFLMVVVWFTLARTKTLSWAWTARLFTACVAWSAVIGWFTLQVASVLGLRAGSDGSGIALAGFLEESGKLVPLLVLVVVAPGRVRRFATVDWALVGFVSGAAFNAYEDALRQVVVQQSWLFWGVSEKTYTLNPWASGRFVTTDGFAVSPGHHIWTAMTAMGIGLAIAWWRAGRRGSRVMACVLPVAMVLLAIAEHASYNAHDTSSSWPEHAGAGFSPVLSGLWSVTGHGRASTVVSVLLLLACLAVDVHRRHQAALLSPTEGDRVRPGGAVADAEPGLKAVAWWHERTAPLTKETPPPRLGARSAVRALAGGSGTLAIRAGAQWWADIAVTLAAHTRTGPESRRDAIGRGRLVSTQVRKTRIEAMTLTTPGTEPPARRRFATVGAVLGVLALVVCVLWGARMAAAIGPYLTIETDTSYLAGLLDQVGNWWNGLDGWQQVAVGAGIAALVTLSGGSLGLAMGVSGVATYGLTHAHGAATFTRHPLAATTDYLTTTTPVDFLLDAGEFALTFAPGNFAGAAAGRGARILAEDIARDPTAFLAAQRAMTHGDAGVVDLAAFMRRDPIELANGSTLLPVDAAQEAAVIARVNALPDGPMLARGRPADYQAQVFGSSEKLVPLSNGTDFAADGITTAYGGSVGDAKLVLADRSFYIPESFADPQMAGFAQERMDLSLRRMADAASNFGGSGTVEIVTNNATSAAAWEARMRALGIDGYARLHPQGG